MRVINVILLIAGLQTTDDKAAINKLYAYWSHAAVTRGPER